MWRDHRIRAQSKIRSRKQACLAWFLTWAYRQDRIPANPMDKIDRVKRTPPVPRGVGRETVETILAGIPTQHKRDRLLFRLIFETGLRIGEALGLHVEDLDLTPDDEHINVKGKGAKPLIVLLDDPRLVRQLRHTHATELVNEGVSLTTIRKRLGHKNVQTTLHYAEQSDATADAELRAWRRQRLQKG